MLPSTMKTAAMMMRRFNLDGGRSGVASNSPKGGPLSQLAFEQGDAARHHDSREATQNQNIHVDAGQSRILQSQIAQGMDGISKRVDHRNPSKPSRKGLNRIYRT